LLLFLTGCAVHLTPALEARPVPVYIPEKLVLRAALLITEEQAAAKSRPILGDGLKTYTTELALGGVLQDTLLLSFSQVFQTIAPVRTPPRLGTYQVVLIPNILDSNWEYSPGFTGVEVKFVVRGALRLVDHAGSELATLRGEGHAASFWASGSGGAALGPVVSRAISELVKKWGEQLVASSHIREYASQMRPTVAAQPGGSGSRPPLSDVTISVSYPAEGARVEEEGITIVGLASAPQGISRLELLVNGQPVPVSRDVRAQPTELQSHPFTAQVPLRVGENVIAVTAVDARGQAAQAARTVYRETPRATGAATAGPRVGLGDRWAVVIGIDHYRDPSISSLRYAAADAQAVYHFLTTKGQVKAANARLLVNQDATQRNIRQILGDFLRQKALTDDEVVIYYAGHGTTEPDKGTEGGIAKYLVPWDADSQSLFSTAIPMEEIDRVFGRLSARKILLIQDTCFSGGAGGRTFLAKGLTVRSGTLTDKFLQELTQKEGRLILTASDVNQVSAEDGALGHGIFTHYLLEGLSGAADLDGDGAITVRELHLYLRRKVHERSGGIQTPQLYAIGDMVLAPKK
jgi:uncharacterized caspase-like protein